MNYMLTPMSSHPDKGLGVVAEAFYKAAKSLDSQSGTLTHLPYCFLLRHSIELNLKSFILLL